MKTAFIAVLVVCATLVAELAFAQGGRGDLRRNRRPIANQYIVVLAGQDDPLAVALQTAAVHGGRVRHVYNNALRGFAMRLTPAAATALSRDSRVLYVEEDGVVQVSAIQAQPPSWGLDRIDQRQLPLNNAYSYASAAFPVYVHVVDTGVRTTHVEFAGRAANAGDFVDDDNDGDPNDVGNDDSDPATPDGRDCNGHGTHVAATIAGTSYGVAKTATILSYRALNCSGNGTTSGVIAAVDAAAADGRRPAVLNMSLGGGASVSLDTAVLRAINAGITVVVAAGNDNVDAGTTSPARVAAAVTVGATGTDDVRASFSNYGNALDLFAPGVGITSAYFTSDVAAAVASGTSMASPHVAGVAALYLSVVGNRTPQQVRDTLVTVATPAIVGGAGAGSPNLLLYSGFLINAAPTVSLTSPQSGASAVAPATFTVSAAAADSDGNVTQVAFYANGSLIATDATAPYSVIWSNVDAGTYSVTAAATDNGGATTSSAAVTVMVTPPPSGGSTVSFVGADTATRGNWRGRYGAQGSVLVADVSSLPSGASVVAGNAAQWTWTASTGDERALQRTSGSDRLAATWYTGAGGPFTLDVAPGDGATHRLTVYAVDWDSTSRSERIDVLDPATGAVLDTRSLSGFNGGEYLTWRVAGGVRIRVTATGGVNAVVSGVFLDADVTGGGSTAAFVGIDTATHGNWKGTYGNQGSVLVADATSLPAGAGVVATNAAMWTWAGSTSDTRALQRTSGSDRVAATWYTTGAPFTLDVTAGDSAAHRVTLYAVDWDFGNRSERIEVLDPVSGDVLDSRTLNDINGGQYVTWRVTGPVRIRVTVTGGINAVVSGVFFDGDAATGGTTATFVGTDPTTGGNWKGKYGQQGSSLPADVTTMPGGGSVVVANAASWTWASSTTDVRALQRTNSTDRLAATWYTAPGPFTLDVTPGDTASHRVTVYGVDWDAGARSERIEILDLAGGAVLDSRNLSDFISGTYVTWRVTGPVRLRVTATGGLNAVISGVFLDD